MKLQPYVDLSKANGTPGESLLLDYTSVPKFLVWILQVQSQDFFLHTYPLLILYRRTLAGCVEHRDYAHDASTSTSCL